MQKLYHHIVHYQNTVKNKTDLLATFGWFTNCTLCFLKTWCIWYCCKTFVQKKKNKRFNRTCYLIWWGQIIKINQNIFKIKLLYHFLIMTKMCSNTLFTVFSRNRLKSHLYRWNEWKCSFKCGSIFLFWSHPRHALRIVLSLYWIEQMLLYQ